MESKKQRTCRGLKHTDKITPCVQSVLNNVNGRGNQKSNRSLFIEFFSACKVSITSIQFISRRIGICTWLIDNCGFSYTTVRYFLPFHFQHHQLGIPCIPINRIKKSDITMNDEDHSVTFTFQENSPALSSTIYVSAHSFPLSTSSPYTAISASKCSIASNSL